MAFPVRTVSRPACLNGQTNGQLDPAILVDSPVLHAVWTCRLVTPAARSWRALAAAALNAGHTLKPSGPSDSYRPYEVQERIFLQRFTTQVVSSTKRTWRGKTWYLRPGYALAAVPGTSNHGWGLAVDVGEETDGDTGTESVDRATVDWLVANEERFGFSHEVQSEPWHLRYFTGDHISAATLDHESIEGDDMPLSDAEWLRMEQTMQKAVQSLLEVDPKTDTALKAKRHSLAAIADAVVAKLPPSSGGGVTRADVVAAVKQALSEGAG